MCLAACVRTRAWCVCVERVDCACGRRVCPVRVCVHAVRGVIVSAIEALVVWAIKGWSGDAIRVGRVDVEVVRSSALGAASQSVASARLSAS